MSELLYLCLIYISRDWSLLANLFRIMCIVVFSSPIRLFRIRSYTAIYSGPPFDQRSEI
jgi:hypothetical protein